MIVNLFALTKRAEPIPVRFHMSQQRRSYSLRRIDVVLVTHFRSWRHHFVREQETPGTRKLVNASSDGKENFRRYCSHKRNNRLIGQLQSINLA